jgi:hypothetical protein
MEQLAAKRAAQAAAEEAAAETASTKSTGLSGTTSASSTLTDTQQLDESTLSVLFQMMAPPDDTTASAEQSGDTTDNPLAQAFSSLDTDGDGTVSETEFTTAATSEGLSAEDASAIYDSIDQDGDGISTDELADATRPTPPPPGAMGDSGSTESTDGATGTTANSSPYAALLRALDSYMAASDSEQSGSTSVTL